MTNASYINTIQDSHADLKCKPVTAPTYFIDLLPKHKHGRLL